MPTYQYACTACGHQLEAVQSFADDPLTQCPACQGRLRKLFGSVGIVFKGSGFYRNDSRADTRPTDAASTGDGHPGKGGTDQDSSEKGGTDKGGTDKGGDKGGTEKGGTDKGGDPSAAGNDSRGRGAGDKGAAGRGAADRGSGRTTPGTGGSADRAAAPASSSAGRS